MENNLNSINKSETIELVKSGDDFFNRLIDLICKSTSEIHFQTYIFENDATGKQVAEALKEASSRGVNIFILVDGYGSHSLSKKFIKELKDCGINFRFFSPFSSSNTFYIGRRLHHKVVVVDNKTVLIGGINVSDKYKGNENKVPWLDFAVQIESAEIAVQVQKICSSIFFKKKRIQRKKIIHKLKTAENTEIKIIRNDWLKHKNEITNSYINAIRKSSKEVIIVGSYFLPGRRLSNVLKTAAGKGVKVKLILSGISDIPLLNRATCFLYSSLLKNKIELFEWNKSVLHGKVAVCDNLLTTIGSFNLNHLSSYASIELNVEVISAEFSSKFSRELITIINQCESITAETLKSRKGLFTNMLNWFAYRLVRIALIIATYLPYKRFNKLF